MGWVQLSSLVRSKRHGTACAIGPKGEASTLGLRASWGPYIQKVIYMVGFKYNPWLGPKDTEPRALLVPKVKLGHSVCVCHGVLIFRKLYKWVWFNYLPWLGPKNT